VRGTEMSARRLAPVGTRSMPPESHVAGKTAWLTRRTVTSDGTILGLTTRGGHWLTSGLWG
jgi:hypothetical protein